MAQRNFPQNSFLVVLKKFYLLVSFLPRFSTERAPTSSIRLLILLVRGRKIWKATILFAGKIARQRFLVVTKKLQVALNTTLDTLMFSFLVFKYSYE